LVNYLCLNVTITNITAADQGIYWCAERKHLYYRSYRKINITVRSGKCHTNVLLIKATVNRYWLKPSESVSNLNFFF
uniref:Immunoglobulin V-set domain-containing protein n=1 Tax=Neogobius melanostomus TaxID=47308 RepID=A0A8C6WLV2_9GOBI